MKGKPIRNLAIIIPALILALAMPTLAKNNYQMLLFNLVLIYIVLTLGLNFSLGLTGQASMGHAALWGIGSYCTAILATRYGLPFYIVMPITIVVGIGFGLFIGLPTTRLKGRYLALATMAFGEIVVIVLMNWAKLTGGPNGILGIPAPVIFGLKLNTTHKFYYFSLAAVVLGLMFTVSLLGSRLGRAMQAIRENELAAEVLGVPTYRIKVLSFILSSVFAAISGSLYVYMQGYVDPNSFTQFESLRVITMLFIGGAGTVVGPILGAILLTVLPEFVRGLKDYYMLVYGAGVVLLMIFMPTGLFGVGKSLYGRYMESRSAQGPKAPQEGGR